MIPHIFAFLWANVAVPLDAATAQMVTAVQGMLGFRFQLAVLAYFVVTLLIACWTPDDSGFTRFFRQLGLASVIFTLATTAPMFNTYVSGLIHGVVTTAGNAMAGVLQQGGPLDGIAFDKIATRAYAAGAAVYKTIPTLSIKGIAFGIAIIIYDVLAFFALMVMFGIYLLSYAFTDFLIGVGPLFVALYFFPYTRNWSDGWIRQVATVVLVQIFTVALASFFIFVLDRIITMIVGGLPAGLAEGGLAPAGEVGDRLVASIMGLLLIAASCLLFSIMSVYIVVLAQSIAHGAFSEVSRFRMGGGGGGVPPSTGSVGGEVASSGGGNADGWINGPPAPPAPPPPRQHAFQRHVGSPI